MPNEKPYWEVQHYTLCDGWTNTWMVDDEKQTFESEAEAQAALDEFFEDTDLAITAGDISHDGGYSREEFRIVHIKPARPCLLVTLEGTKEAKAWEIEELGVAGYPICKIMALDGSCAMSVYKTVYDRKFEAEDKPTFYAC